MIEINTNIKIAVAGCGSAGRNNIREFLKMDDLEISACCDTEEALAQFTAREFGIPSWYTSVAEMLDASAVDALIVAVPDGEHLSVSLEAFGRGIHVFCENPLASNYAEAVEMTRAARESGLIAMMNNDIFEIPVVKSALNYIAEGSLGRVKYFEASYMQNRLEPAILNDPYEEKRLLSRLSAVSGSAGAVGELGSALFDVAAKVCGTPSEVSGLVKNISGFENIEEYYEFDLTAGDTFICQLDFLSGAVGVIRGSWTAGGAHQQVTMNVYGEQASLSLDTNASENSFTVVSANGSATLPADAAAGNSLYDDFISAVKGEGTTVSDFDQALQIQYYIEQSRLSAEGGLRLPLDTGEFRDE